MVLAWAEHKKELFLNLISISAFVYLAYYLDRSHFYELIGCFTVCFGIYYYTVKRARTVNLPLFMGLGILFRLLFIHSIPTLSDDYFRFIWDGQLILNGQNPFNLLPAEVLIDFPNKTELLAGMNSPDYYTVYPPIAQSIYFLSAWLSPNSIFGSIVVMRTIVIAIEIGTILLLPKLLTKLNLDPKQSLWYTLNPLVIVELTGNLHFEGIVIFFFLIAVYLLVIQKEKLSSLAWAFAAASKLIPIFFLPIVLRKIPFKKAIVFYCLFGVAFFALWLPFINNTLLPHFLASVQLYSKTFEFNASVYYLVRAVGYEVMEYNIIQTAGPWLGRLAYLGILILLLKKKVIQWQQFFTLLLFSLSWYYLLALIVHPWYSITLVFLAVFTRFRYPMLWSALAVLSYWAYSNPNFQENFWLVGVEYSLVVITLIRELISKKSLSSIEN